MADAVAVAILAKAPVPGFTKTRLISVLGAEGAATLQNKLIARTVTTAAAAKIGPITLWVTPDDTDALFASLSEEFGVQLQRQPEGDLGDRMYAASERGPTLVIGTDCPALTADHLRAAAEALGTHDAVTIPAEDGGYVLIGTRKPQPAIFSGMKWGTSTVMAETRKRLLSLGCSWQELPALWDVDTPEDLARMQRDHPPD
jgi:rSAM/selenodomain-associated transferase 1